MFNLGWDKLLILLIAALVILGPERLPGVVTQALRTIRRIRRYAEAAALQAKSEIGPEFEELRRPLAELTELTQRALVEPIIHDDDVDRGLRWMSADEPPVGDQ